MDAAPAISVHLAVRNGTPYLAETIGSLAALVGEDLEFVVVDDGSTDDTPQLLASWAARDSRVRVETLPAGPGGIPVALNRGLELCRGEFVARADGDDLYDPQRLVRQRARMVAEPRLDALSCSFHRIDPRGLRIGTVQAVTGPDVIGFTAMFQNLMLHSGTMVRRATLEKLGGYDTAYWTAQDSDLFARMVAAGCRIDNLPEPLVSYRVHNTSRMNTRGTEGQALSLTVPTRMQAAYLGGLPENHDVEASVALYQSRRPLGDEALDRGLTALDRIDALATRREPPQVLSYFRSQVAASLRRQAGWTSRRRPLRRLKLRRMAARWLPEAGYGR